MDRIGHNLIWLLEYCNKEILSYELNTTADWIILPCLAISLIEGHLSLQNHGEVNRK